MTRLDLINELLRHEDIEGLLSIGAPDDEYESEAEMIADRIGAAEERHQENQEGRSREGCRLCLERDVAKVAARLVP